MGGPSSKSTIVNLQFDNEPSRGNFPWEKRPCGCIYDSENCLGLPLILSKVTITDRPEIKSTYGKRSLLQLLKEDIVPGSARRFVIKIRPCARSRGPLQEIGTHVEEIRGLPTCQASV